MTEFILSNYQSVNNDIRVEYMKKECSRIFKLMNETIQDQREEFEKFRNETTSLMESMGFIIQKQQKEINELKNKLQEEKPIIKTLSAEQIEERIINTIHEYIDKEYIETQIEDTIVKIQNNIDIISNTEINILGTMFPINSKIIRINSVYTDANRRHNEKDWNKIQYLFQLEELHINSINVCIFHIKFSNKSVKKISIANCSIFNFEFLQNFPNLEELYFGSVWAIPDNLNLNHLNYLNENMKQISIINCPSLNIIIFDLQMHCKKKNINLILK